MKQFIMIAFASLPLLLAGCSTERIADYQPAAPSASEHTALASGVVVALDPFVESARTKQYFDIDAVAEGIAILHVRVTNQTADQTFLVEKKDFQLRPDGAAGGLTGDGKQIQRSHTTENTLNTIGTIGVATEGIGLIGVGLIGLAMNSQSAEIQRNLTGKEMPDATLSPGKSMEGFIYFTPVKKGTDWTRTTAVSVNLTETRTRQMLALSIPLSH
jgi:hypothetical protein